MQRLSLHNKFLDLMLYIDKNIWRNVASLKTVFG